MADSDGPRLADGLDQAALAARSASHLGQFACSGEVAFSSGDDPGVAGLRGVAVFQAANGEYLVAAVFWDVDAGTSEFHTSGIHYSWRDGIQFSDGMVAYCAGPFAGNRPPGLVVIAIIAIPLGMPSPAVRKVREGAR